MDLRIAAAVAAGGAIGALLRHVVTSAVTRTAFPYGTLIVNVTGSFLLALVLFVDLQRGQLGPTFRAFVAVGILGAFTTMSTLGYETLALFQDGEATKATLNAGLNLVLSLTAATLGLMLANLMTRAPLP